MANLASVLLSVTFVLGQTLETPNEGKGELSQLAGVWWTSNWDEYANAFSCRLMLDGKYAFVTHVVQAMWSGGYAIEVLRWDAATNQIEQWRFNPDGTPSFARVTVQAYLDAKAAMEPVRDKKELQHFPSPEGHSELVESAYVPSVDWLDRSVMRWRSIGGSCPGVLAQLANWTGTWNCEERRADGSTLTGIEQIQFILGGKYLFSALYDDSADRDVITTARRIRIFGQDANDKTLVTGWEFRDDGSRSTFTFSVDTFQAEGTWFTVSGQEVAVTCKAVCLDNNNRQLDYQLAGNRVQQTWQEVLMKKQLDVQYQIERRPASKGLEQVFRIRFNYYPDQSVIDVLEAAKFGPSRDVRSWSQYKAVGQWREGDPESFIQELKQLPIIHNVTTE